MKKTLITLFALGSVFLSTAHGQNRVFSMVTGHGFEDIYNFGFGMRIGKNLDLARSFALYGGAIGVYHQGKTQKRDTADENTVVETTDNISFAGGEVGLKLRLQMLTINPSVLLAWARINQDIPLYDKVQNLVGKRDENSTEFFAGPGLQIGVPFGNMTISGEIRRHLVKKHETWALYSALTFRF